MFRNKFHSEARLSWVLAGLAGLLGATAYTHSAGYFVTFMTGNAQRAVLGAMLDDPWLSISATLLAASFVAGVVTAALCLRFLWSNRPHGAIVITTLALVTATVLDATVEGGPALPLPFMPIALVTFGIGALNTTFVKNGEVSIPLSYVTGTLVKMGQGMERHLAGGGGIMEWLGYFLLWFAFVVGAAIGGVISLYTGGTQMLAISSLVCALTTGYTHFYADRHGVWV